VPLTHVAHLKLLDLPADTTELSGIPTPGLLEIFHDLTTYGDVDDLGSSAWLVRWTPAEDGAEMEALDAAPPVDPPLDLDPDHTIPAVACQADLAPTIPSPLDLGDVDEETWERYDRVHDLLERNMYLRNALFAPGVDHGDSPWGVRQVTLEPMSRLGGYGYNERNSDYEAILHEVLPLVGGDHHVMLADIIPATFTDADWFHGQRHLQIWIRASDLEARRFDCTWSFIRTDG